MGRYGDTREDVPVLMLRAVSDSVACCVALSLSQVAFLNGGSIEQRRAVRLYGAVAAVTGQLITWGGLLEGYQNSFDWAT